MREKKEKEMNEVEVKEWKLVNIKQLISYGVGEYMKIMNIQYYKNI